MLVHLRKIPELAFEKVHYYTVRLEKKEISEYKEFQQVLGKCRPLELGEINSCVKLIGERYGAQNQYFKEQVQEKGTNGVPSVAEVVCLTEFGIELLGIKLSKSIMILLNGGLKRSSKAGTCLNLLNAEAIARKINIAIFNGNIEIDEEQIEIIIEDGFYLEI